MNGLTYLVTSVGATGTARCEEYIFWDLPAHTGIPTLIPVHILITTLFHFSPLPYVFCKASNAALQMASGIDLASVKLHGAAETHSSFINSQPLKGKVNEENP